MSRFSVHPHTFGTHCVSTIKVTEDSDSAEMFPRDYEHPHCEAYAYAAAV